MTEMNQYFKLTKQEFDNNASSFHILEIREEQVLGKNYQYLSEYLKKQYQNLAIENYPQNNADRSKYDEIYKIIKTLKNTLSL